MVPALGRIGPVVIGLSLALLASTGSVSAAVPDSATPVSAGIAQIALDLDPVARPAIRPPKRSRTIAAPVPASLLATLHVAATTMSLPYLDGCHGAPATTTRCFYGKLDSKTTIALFGDSHALSWFPALLKVAEHRGWRLLSLTRSACIPASVIPYDRRNGFVMRSCQVWRDQAIARLVRERPAIVVVSGTRGFATVDSAGRLLSGKAKTNAWIKGMKRTLARIVPAAGRVILLADTPSSLLANPATCLARNPGNALKCSTTVAHAISYPWLNTEYGVAKDMSAGFLNVERWVCPTSPCPAIIGSRLVYRNPGHLTASFTASQWLRLEQAILKDLARRDHGHWP